MILPIMIVALATTGQALQQFECGNIVTKTSEFWSNSAGLRVALRVHTEDDHAKNSHQCESSYTLVIVCPDGTSTENQMYSVIDEWGRPIEFWIDGFASKGHKLIATSIEGESWQTLVFDLKEPELAPEVYLLSKQFLKALSLPCRKSLRTVGITQEGDPVIAGSHSSCGQGHSLWKVKHGPRKVTRNIAEAGATPDQSIPLREHSEFEVLEPRRLPSM
jgi:hypothetical protein